MKRLMVLMTVLAAVSARASHAGGNIIEDDFYILAEFLNGDGHDQGIDESGWNGQVEQLDQPALDQYAASYSRLGAVAAVQPMENAIEKSKCKPQRGLASWYGGGFQGQKTANGEYFDTNSKTDMTAAHKSLPWGTRVRVTNRKNGLSVIVRINDRGPYVSGRVIDVSHEAAKALHLDGIGPVELSCI